MIIHLGHGVRLELLNEGVRVSKNWQNTSDGYEWSFNIPKDKWAKILEQLTTPLLVPLEPLNEERAPHGGATVGNLDLNEKKVYEADELPVKKVKKNGT